MAALRELELEFRYLSDVEARARRERLDWVIRFMQDLKTNLREFGQREHAEDLNGTRNS